MGQQRSGQVIITEWKQLKEHFATIGMKRHLSYKVSQKRRVSPLSKKTASRNCGNISE